jgi:hypothetical protein
MRCHCGLSVVTLLKQKTLKSIGQRQLNPLQGKNHVGMMWKVGEQYLKKIKIDYAINIGGNTGPIEDFM